MSEECGRTQKNVILNICKVLASNPIPMPGGQTIDLSVGPSKGVGNNKKRKYKPLDETCQLLREYEKTEIIARVIPAKYFQLIVKEVVKENDLLGDKKFLAKALRALQEASVMLILENSDAKINP